MSSGVAEASRGTPDRPFSVVCLLLRALRCWRKSVQRRDLVKLGSVVGTALWFWCGWWMGGDQIKGWR